MGRGTPQKRVGLEAACFLKLASLNSSPPPSEKKKETGKEKGINLFCSSYFLYIMGYAIICYILFLNQEEERLNPH